MAELIGKKAVTDFITGSDMKKFKILGSGSSAKQAPKWVCEDGDPVDSFNTWAAMVNNDGANTDEYKLRVYEVDDDEAAEGGTTKRGRRRSLQISFCLNQSIRQVAAPAAPLVTAAAPTITNETLAAAIAGAMARNQPQQDSQTMINAAVEKVAHLFQIEALIKNQEQIIQNMTQQMADMRDDFTRRLEEEEEEETQNAIASAQIKAAEIDAEKWNIVAKAAAPALEKLTDVLIQFVPGQKINAPAPGLKTPSMAVNGARLGANQQQNLGWKPVISDKKGELPLHPDTDADEEDQRLKIKYFTDEMLPNNDCMGDDLLLLLKVYKDMPSKFEEMLMQLRQEFAIK